MTPLESSIHRINGTEYGTGGYFTFFKRAGKVFDLAGYRPLSNAETTTYVHDSLPTWKYCHKRTRFIKEG